MNQDAQQTGPAARGPEPHAERTRRTLPQRLRAYFLTGIVVTAPIAITVYLTWLFINAIDERVRPFIPVAYNPETYLPFSLPGIGLVLVIVVFTLLGALTANFFGRFLLRAGERVVDRMPIVRTIYATLKQIFQTVVSQSADSFQGVVLVEYPRKGIWAIAFVTSATKGEVQRRTERDLINIFLPTTPNPTSGFLLFVPRNDLIYLDMTVEDGIKNVISAGLVTPPDRKGVTAVEDVLT
ncbi:MAG: DUF502 domain-containing protein [Sphingomonadales bacterium]